MYDANRIRVSFEQTKIDIEDCFARWGVKQWDVRPLREPGPRADQKAVVRWEHRGTETVLELAAHPAAYQNLRVLYLAIDALRKNELRGLSEVMREAYLQLPAPAAAPARNVAEALAILELTRVQNPTLADAEAAYRSLAQTYHPDRGGTAGAMARLNTAIDVLRKAYRS